MKLLLFSDLHANKHLAERLVQQSQTVDVVVGAGDFANARREILVCLDVLKAIEKPAVLVAGNNETSEELRDACSDWPSACVLHGDSVTIAEVVFYGLGGGVPITPFGAWSYDFSEDEARSLLAECPPRSILVTHSPPQGAVDLSSQGKSLGSIAVRETILRSRPRLVVCGHIHASAGQQGLIGNTPVINAGPKGIEWVVKLQDL